MSDDVVRSEIADMRGHGALPRSNGELVFAAPWEGRALAMAIGVVKALGLAWDEFRLRLIAEISAHPERVCPPSRRFSSVARLLEPHCVLLQAKP